MHVVKQKHSALQFAQVVLNSPLNANTTISVFFRLIIHKKTVLISQSAGRKGGIVQQPPNDAREAEGMCFGAPAARRLARLRSLLLPLIMVLSHTACALPMAKSLRGFRILSIMVALLAQRVVVITDVNQHILFRKRTSAQVIFLNRSFPACFVLVTVKLTVLASNVVS